MKCPHCEYEHGFTWVGDNYTRIEGEHGDFYELPVEVKRYNGYSEQSKYLYACPSCSKTFIEH